MKSVRSRNEEVRIGKKMKSKITGEAARRLHRVRETAKSGRRRMVLSEAAEPEIADG
jgi:hypothetical protein